MSNYTNFMKRLAELTRGDHVIWRLSEDGTEYDAVVDNYTARLAFYEEPNSAPGAGPSLRFQLYDRTDRVAEVRSRKTRDFRASDDGDWSLKSLFDAVQRQQTSRESSAFEDFLSRAEV